MADDTRSDSSDTLFDSLMRLSGQVAGGTLELARNTATLTAIFGETWLRNTLLNSLEPERLEAMAEAGHFLRDARETAGLSLKDLSESLGLSDKEVLEEVESGDKIMPLELVLRSASLLARHDPIPFLLKFLRTYNPQLEKTLESWGMMALPKHYERERRFTNLYRKHDVLRDFSDDEFQRFIDYMESSSNLVLDVMTREKEANTVQRRSPAAAKTKSNTKSKTKAKAKTETQRSTSAGKTTKQQRNKARSSDKE